MMLHKDQGQLIADPESIDVYSPHSFMSFLLLPIMWWYCILEFHHRRGKTADELHQISYLLRLRSLHLSTTNWKFGIDKTRPTSSSYKASFKTSKENFQALKIWRFSCCVCQSFTGPRASLCARPTPVPSSGALPSPLRIVMASSNKMADTADAAMPARRI